MGEASRELRTQFNGSIRIEARAERMSSEAGALLLREVDERLGVTAALAERLEDRRAAHLITHPLPELLRTAIHLQALGWRDHDDADALRDDSVLRLSVSNRRGISPLATRPPQERERDHNPEHPDGLASQPTLSRLTAMLSRANQRTALRETLCEAASKRILASRGGRRLEHLTLDVDALPIEVHGQQIGADYNGHVHSRMYHPLVATSAETGDLFDVQLRHGTAHSAEGALWFILELVRRLSRDVADRVSVRVNAGFPEDRLRSSLEEFGTRYVARIRNNPVLDRMAQPHLKRPVGRPPRTPRMWCHEMTYAANTWSKPRRAVLVVVERPGELFLKHFWLITNWGADEKTGEVLTEHYRERGTAEGHLGELKDVLAPQLSSTTRTKTTYAGHAVRQHVRPVEAFEVNEVRLLLSAFAYNLMHAVRVGVESVTREGASLRHVRERLLRAACRILVHGRRALVVIAQHTAALWHRVWPALPRLAVTRRA